MAKPDETSIWKKEITFRRKPREPKEPKEQGSRVPPVSEPPAKPESVAALLRPLAETPLDPVVLPPVTPPVASPAPPERPPEPEPEPAAKPPVRDGGPVEGARGNREVPPAGRELKPAPVPVLPVPEPERSRAPSRRERKQAARAAERLAREQQRRATQAAKEARKTAPPVHNRVVGLKIGGSQIAAAEVVNKGGSPRLVRAVRTPLERGVVVGGELREPEELAAALKTFFRKNKLPRNCVRLGISNNRIGVRTFEITGIEDPRQLANAIRFRAQETLPIPLDEAVLDYRVLEDNVGEDGVRTRRVLLVVAHRELVDRYVAACRKAGLKLIGIDLEAFALLRALGDSGRPATAADDAGLVCVSIGHDRSTLAVSDGRICEFTRVLPWGGSALDVALARVLDLTPSEAEPIKRDLSLTGNGEAGGLDARRAEAARHAMAAEVEVFARELVASLRFYQEQPGSLGIGEILLTGGGAACAGLAEELERLIGVTVRAGDPLGRVKVPRKLRRQNGSTGSLAVAVGLGIED